MDIIRKRETMIETHYQRSFVLKDGRHGSGYGFDSDENGNIYFGALNHIAAENAYKLLAGEMPEYEDAGVVSWKSRYTEPAVGLCECGAEVILDGFTNTCDCGRDYNSSGSLLAPRSQWGEETGESLADILRIK